jgi:5-methylcytosine-specific restriction endonuclease McrA
MAYKDIEKRRAACRAYDATHKAQTAARGKAWNLAHPEKSAQKQRKWRETHLEQCRAYGREYAKTHRVKRLQYLRDHPEAHRAAVKKARAKRRSNRGVIHDLSHAQWLEIQAMQGHRCYYCGKRCKGKLTQDHIIPLSKGGAHTLHNVIAACHSCNSKKHTGPPPKPVQPLLLTIAPSKKPRKRKAA